MNYLFKLGALLLFGLLFSNGLFCQVFKVDRNYYATDTSSISGIKIKDEGSVKNSEFCHFN